MESKDDQLYGIHVVFVIDIHLKPQFDNNLLTQSLDAILAFGNSFLMQCGQNKLSILGSSAVSNSILYIDQQQQQFSSKKDSSNHMFLKDQQNERFASITQTFRENLISWVEECSSVLHRVLLDGGQEKRNMLRNNTTMSSLLSGSLSQALCLINRYRNQLKHSRIVIFSLGTDHTETYSSQYTKLINCFFAAQKIDVMIDACSVALSRENEDLAPVSASMEDNFAVSILQQGCDLTNGRYIRVHKVASLLEHLFWCLTPSAVARSQMFVLPPKPKTSAPVACFCHRKFLPSKEAFDGFGIGYVCSVCVSIFCHYTPLCSTCNSNVFKSTIHQVAKLKALDHHPDNDKESF